MIDLRELIQLEPNLIEDEVCQKWIKFFEDHIDLARVEDSKKYEIDYQSKDNDKDNYLALNLTQNYHRTEFKPITNEVFSYITKMIYKYEDYLKSKISPVLTREYMTDSSVIRILRYKPGQEIKDHLDIGGTAHRASCTLNLNSDYTGGDFSFFTGRHMVKLSKGDGMIFPAEQVWIHGTRPITSGVRYCVNAYLKPAITA